MIDCNEWRTEKRHECTNMGKVKRLELWWQLYVTLLPRRDVRNIRPMDFCSTECTSLHKGVNCFLKKWCFNDLTFLNTAVNFISSMFVYANACWKNIPVFYFMNLATKKIHRIFQTCHIICFIFPKKCHSFHNFSFFGSNNIHVLHQPCAKI